MKICFTYTVESLVPWAMRLLFCLMFFCLFGTKSINAQSYLAGASPFQDSLWVLDTTNFEVVQRMAPNMPGQTITGMNGIARHPLTGVYYIICKVSGVSGRVLGTIDLSTGTVTQVGNLGDNFASITFNANGTLYGVTGDGATVKETVYRISTVDASKTLLLALGNGADGEVICFNPDDNMIYHWSGNGTVVYEKFDTSGTTVTGIPIVGTTNGETFGAVYKGNGTFITSNIGSSFNTFDTQGNVTAAFGSNPDDLRGLVFFSANAAPVVSSIDNLSGCEGVNFGNIAFSVTDADGDSVTVSASSSNQAVLLDSKINLQNTGPDSVPLYDSISFDGFEGPGTTTVTISVSDGTNTTLRTFDITILPTVNDGALTNYIAPVCLNTESFELTGESAPGGEWSIDGTAGSIFVPASLGVGAHAVSYGYQFEGSCYVKSQSVIVKPVTIPTLADFDTICENDGLVILSGGSPEGGSYSGAGVSEGEFDPSVTGAGSENAITYTYTNASYCTASATANIVVLSAPSVTLNTFPSVCVNSSPLDLSELVGDFSGTGISNNTFYPSTAGVGTFIISQEVVIENGCSASDTATITVKGLPEVAISPVSDLCDNSAAVTLTANPSGGIFSGTGVSGSTFNPATSGSGEFQVIYTATENGCTNSDTTVVAVNAAPEVSIEATSTSFCPGGLVTLSISGEYESIQWLKDGTPIPQANGMNYMADQAGAYKVFVENMYCSAFSAVVTITENNNPEPGIGFEGAPNFCEESSLVLEATGGEFDTYQWLLNGETIQGATGSTYAASVTGDYSVSVTLNGCSGVSVEVPVSSSSPVSIVPDRSPVLCAGGQITFTSSTATTYQWRKDGENIEGATSVSFTTGEAGSYSVFVTDGNGCEATSGAIEVSINQLPVPSIVANGATEFCAGNSVELSTQEYKAYRWRRGNQLLIGGSFQSYLAYQGGDYTVQVTDDNGCVGLSEPIAIQVNVLPEVSINPSDVNYICSGQSLEMSVPGGAFRYQWLKNEQPISGATSNTYLATEAGSYQAVVMNDERCSATSATVIVFVKPTPEVPTVTFTGTSLMSSSAINYQWYKNGEVINGATTQTLVINTNGVYVVEVTGENGCSSRSQEMNITNIGISSYGGAASFTVYPNPFSESFAIQGATEGTYVLYDLSGKQLLTGKLSPQQKTTVVSPEGLAAGVYQLSIQQNGMPEKMIKLVK